MSNVTQRTIVRNTYEDSARALREEISDLRAKVSARRSAADQEYLTLVDLGYSPEAAGAVMASRLTGSDRRRARRYLTDRGRKSDEASALIRSNPFERVLGGRDGGRRINAAAVVHNALAKSGKFFRTDAEYREWRERLCNLAEAS